MKRRCFVERRCLVKQIKKASFTVEAAFIMPFILFVLFGILRTGFMLHDEAVLEAAASGVLEKGEMAVKHRGDIETGRPDYEELLLKEKEEEKREACQKRFMGELSDLFFMKKIAEIKLCIQEPLLGESKIELLGNAGKRSLTVFDPAEYMRRKNR